MYKLPTCSLLGKGNEGSVSSPLQVRLIKFLGLQKYVMDNFIFKRKTPKYCIRTVEGTPTLITDTPLQAPPGYTLHPALLEANHHSVPVCRLVPNNPVSDSVIVYAHGNASDMSDSYGYVERLAKQVESEYVIFDYSGYGESRVADVGEEVICGDLEIVLAWLGVQRIRRTILWGFSLGTFPVVHAATKYPVKGVVLQCPIASVSCLFHKELHPGLKFEEDHFSNLDMIGKIKGRLFITHSTGDEIIPFNHAKLLFDKFVKINGHGRITFIQVAKIRHNSLHRFITAETENDLQKEVFDFLTGLLYLDGGTVPTSPRSSQSSLYPHGSHTSLGCDPISPASKEELTHLHRLTMLGKKVEEVELEELGEMNELVVEEDNNQRVTIKRSGWDGKSCLCFNANN